MRYSGCECGRNSRSSPAAGNGLFGRGDRTPKIPPNAPAYTETKVREFSGRKSSQKRPVWRRAENLRFTETRSWYAQAEPGHSVFCPQSELLPIDPHAGIRRLALIRVVFADQFGARNRSPEHSPPSKAYAFQQVQRQARQIVAPSQAARLALALGAPGVSRNLHAAAAMTATVADFASSPSFFWIPLRC